MKNKFLSSFLFFTLLLTSIFIVSCNKAPVQPEPVEQEEKQDEEILDTKDRFGREYTDDYIEIPSEELREATIDFWTRLSLGDESFVDYIYLDDDKKQGLKNLANDEKGKELYQLLLENCSIETDGIPAARFLKSDIDEDGNSVVNQISSEIKISGKDYSNFLDIMRLKFEEPIASEEEFFDYIKRYNEFYPAFNTNDTAIQFCYIEGKPLIKGDLFLEYFGIYRGVNKDTKTVMDLIQNAYLIGIEESGDMKIAMDLLRNGEFIKLYEFLKNQGYNQEFNFDPTETIKLLYTSSDEIRRVFLEDLAKLPKPLVKTFTEDGKTKTLVCYYYPDVYRLDSTGEICEELFYVEKPGDISGFMFENIIKNLLVKQGITIQ